MHFRLNEEQLMLRDMVRDFVNAEVAPAAPHWNDGVPDALFPQLGGRGLLGIHLSEAFGGANMGLLATCVALEELAAGDAGLALSVLSHAVLCSGHLERRAHCGSGAPKPMRCFNKSVSISVSIFIIP